MPGGRSGFFFFPNLIFVKTRKYRAKKKKKKKKNLNMKKKKKILLAALRPSRAVHRKQLFI